MEGGNGVVAGVSAEEGKVVDVAVDVAAVDNFVVVGVVAGGMPGFGEEGGNCAVVEEADLLVEEVVVGMG